MVTKNKQDFRRLRIKHRIRKVVNGTPDRPRMSVFRSSKSIYVQLIDDLAKKTIVTASSAEKAMKDASGTKTEIAKLVGKLIAEKAIQVGISQVVFDRSGFLYHGSYKTGNYQKAAIMFANALQNDPSAVSPSFYLGLSQLALKNYDQAINLFIKVVNDSGEYGKEARWFMGLAYLKLANKVKAAECFEYLARSDGFYRERSETILLRLK